MIQSLNTQPGFGGAGASIRRFFHWLGKASFGIFLLVAAGLALIATTFIGLLLTAVAVLIRLAHSIGGKGRSSSRSSEPFFEPRTSRSTHGQEVGEAGTLDAHQTPDGWVVDSTNSTKR